MLEGLFLISRSNVDSVVELFETLLPWIVILRLFNGDKLVFAHVRVEERCVVFKDALVEGFPVKTI